MSICSMLVPIWNWKYKETFKDLKKVGKEQKTILALYWNVRPIHGGSIWDNTDCEIRCVSFWDTSV